MRLRILAQSFMNYPFLLAWMLSCLTASTVMAQPMGLAITADRLEMDDKNQIAIFIGHVLADDGRMRLSSDKMTVYYDKKNKKGNKGGVREVKAEGQVVLQQEKNKGMADVVHYQLEKRTLELVGNNQDASIRREEDLLTGRRILVTLDNEQRISKVSVQGSETHRVSARITPSGLMERVETPLRVNTQSAPPPLPRPPEESGDQQNKEGTGQTATPAVENKEPTRATPEVQSDAQGAQSSGSPENAREETVSSTGLEERDVEAPQPTKWSLPTPQPRRRTHPATWPKR